MCKKKKIKKTKNQKTKNQKKMLYLPTIMSVLEVLAVTIPVLLTVAFVTVAERKTMASMQRRLGPNAVG
jgi:NADH:ubiquinone oxidoreductase subunit H